MAHIGSRELHTGFWQGNLNESDHLDDLGIDVRAKRIFKKQLGFCICGVEPQDTVPHG
jgi:hypothetical protein